MTATALLNVHVGIYGTGNEASGWTLDVVVRSEVTESVTKNEKQNHESINPALAFAVLFALLLSITCQRATTQTATSATLLFEGTIEKMAPDLGMLSGVITVYRPVRYRVEKVCRGEYKEKLIVVDHLILSGKELEGLSVGDRVCVSVTASDKIITRYDAEGIRNPSDIVKTFFVSDRTQPVNTSCCTEPED